MEMSVTPHGKISQNFQAVSKKLKPYLCFLKKFPSSSQKFLKKTRKQVTKAMSDLEHPKNVEYLFQRFLFILKPTAFHQEIILMKKSIESIQNQKNTKKTVH